MAYSSTGDWGGVAAGTGFPSWAVLLFLALILAWVLLWKGLALWHSAQRGQSGWFIVLLFVNTAGVLEIIYLFAVAKLKARELFTSRPPTL